MTSTGITTSTHKKQKSMELLIISSSRLAVQCWESDVSEQIVYISNYPSPAKRSSSASSGCLETKQAPACFANDSTALQLAPWNSSPICASAYRLGQ